MICIRCDNAAKDRSFTKMRLFEDWSEYTIYLCPDCSDDPLTCPHMPPASNKVRRREAIRESMNRNVSRRLRIIFIGLYGAGPQRSFRGNFARSEAGLVSALWLTV